MRIDDDALAYVSFSTLLATKLHDTSYRYIHGILHEESARDWYSEHPASSPEGRGRDHELDLVAHPTKGVLLLRQPWIAASGPASPAIRETLRDAEPLRVRLLERASSLGFDAFPLGVGALIVCPRRPIDAPDELAERVRIVTHFDDLPYALDPLFDACIDRERVEDPRTLALEAVLREVLDAVVELDDVFDLAA